MTRTKTHDGAAVKAWNLGETEQEPDLMATYLIGLSSTIDPASWSLSFTVLSAASPPLF
jgi:hypothetical protein